jgi:hypothetical protein
LGSTFYSARNTVRLSHAAITLLLTAYGTACRSWHTERVAPDALLATRQPAEVRVTRTDGSRIVMEQPALVGDTLVLAAVVGAGLYAAFVAAFLASCSNCH